MFVPKEFYNTETKKTKNLREKKLCYALYNDNQCWKLNESAINQHAGTLNRQREKSRSSDC